MANIICGVDISKARLDACVWPGGLVRSFDADLAGIDALARFCAEQHVELVALESSGGLERRPFAVLSMAGLACALVNPGRVRDYARAMGALEKTDRLDAAMIARYAIASQARPTPAPSGHQSRLKALVARLRQVSGDTTIQKQRRASAPDAETIESLNEVIALLRRQARRLEGEIASMIDDDPLWARLDETFRSIKGVAGRTVARLMAELPEIGVYSNKAISKLVGLAPLANDSGARQGRRSIRGGRAGVRSILFLVAAVAARFDETLRAFHQKLILAGKPKMVARIALAHKLLVRLNAKARQTRTQMNLAT